MSSRYAKIIVIVGVRGCGKTTLVRKLITENKQKTIICTPHNYEWTDLQENGLKTPSDFEFKGAQRHIINSDTLKRLPFFSNGAIVFDDCINFLPSNPKTADGKSFMQFLIDGRHKAVDFFAVAHGITQISPCFYPYISDIVMFKTTDNLTLAKSKIQYFDELQALQNRVNERAKKNQFYCERLKL